MKLMSEYTEQHIETIIESKEGGGKSYAIEGVFAQAESKTITTNCPFSFTGNTANASCCCRACRDPTANPCEYMRTAIGRGVSHAHNYYAPGGH